MPLRESTLFTLRSNRHPPDQPAAAFLPRRDRRARMRRLHGPGPAAQGGADHRRRRSHEGGRFAPYVVGGKGQEFCTQLSFNYKIE
jgi:hypothetical protein